MRFLKASPSRISFRTRNTTKWVGFFLFIANVFIVSNAKAVPLFEGFENDLGSTVHFKLMAIVDPKSISLGDRFALNIKIEVSEGWHIYSLDAKEVEEEFLATEIIIYSDLFVPQGIWEESTPTIQWDGALERVVRIHKQIVEFRRWYHAVESTPVGPHEIKGVVVFRSCNNKICNLPREISFKTEINVHGGKS